MRVLAGLLWILVTASVAFASEGAHHEISLKMEIFRIINFAVFVWLLYKFAGNAVKKYFTERRENISRSLEEAKKVREEAQRMYNEAKAKVENLESEVKAILSNAEKEKEEQVARIREETEKMVQRIKEQAKATVNLEVERAKLELQQEAIDLAVEVAQKLLQEKITPEDQKRLLSDYINKVKEVH